MNQWKSAYAAKTKARTLAEALEGADALFGLSAKGAVTQDMVRSMAAKPIIFAMANPDPEITPEDVHAVRDDAIVATGRSDYPNQINNVLGFPFIFRGALDVQASTINEAMKIAAAEALAELARAEVPDQVAAAFHGRRPTFGPEYIIPGAVRSAPHRRRPAGRRQGGDGQRRGAQADRRHGRLCGAAQRPARSAGRLAAVDLQRRARSIPSASSSPRPRSPPSSAPPTATSRRASAQPILIGIGRRRARAVPRPRHGAAPRVRADRHAQVPAFGGVHRLPLRAPAAARISASAIASGSSPTSATSSPR